MNCQDVADLLNATDRPVAALRSALWAHAASCPDCDAAFRADLALRIESAPQLPSDLMTRISSSLDSIEFQRAGSRLPRRATIGAAFLVSSGAVLAAIGLVNGYFVSDDRGVAADSRATPDNSLAVPGPAPVDDPVTALIEFVDASQRQDWAELEARVSSQVLLPDGDMFALLKVAPVYPRQAAEGGLEGFTLVEFVVNEQGDVDDVQIVDSSHAVFEQPSLEATRQFKYKPRISGGIAVRAEGIRNRIGFELNSAAGSGPGVGPDSQSADPDGLTPDALGTAEFNAAMAPAYDCLVNGNLLCIELALDEVLASHTLSRSQSFQAWNIYGFVQHRRGNYERAIEAYWTAVRSVASEGGFMAARPLMTIARIHYDRHQYQQALDAALAYLRSAVKPSIGDYIFVDHLRELGATVR